MSRVFRTQDKAPRAVRVSRPRGKTADSVEDPAAVAEELRRQAEEELAAARREVAELIDAARAENAAVREEAVRRGYEEGREKGYGDGLAEVEDLTGQAMAALQEARKAFNSMLREAEPRLLALALDAAKRVAAEGIRSEPEVILDMVRRGMEALKDEREFSVRVDPELLAIVEGARDDLGREYAARSVEVLPDEAVKDGAVIGTPHGFVDVTLESQIRNISMAIAEARKRAVGDVQ